MQKGIEQQIACNGHHEFVRTHSRTYSGLIGRDDDDNANALMYVRPEVVEMWSKLKELQVKSKISQLHVQGPPGTGKSTVAWAWACFTAQKKNVIWAHITKSEQSITICHFDRGKMKSFTVPVKKFEFVISSQSNKLDADIMIIDGVTTANYSNIMSDAFQWKLDGTDRKIALITSQQITIPLHELQQAKILTWSMPSWKWDDYFKACQNSDFYKQVEEFLPKQEMLKEEKLAAKYYLAGASARWMFGIAFDVLKAEIDKQLAKVENKKLLLAGLSGNKCQGAVGHLTMVNSEGKTFLVSRYVMRTLAETADIELEFLNKARDYARQYRNPAFEGWVVEFDFLFRVRQAARDADILGLIVQNGEEQDMLPVTSLTCGVDPTDAQKMQHLDTTSGSWFFPKLWNQGGYDAVYITSETVHFVQITRSDKHSLKLRYMRQFLINLPNSKDWKVEIIFAVPKGTDFALPTGSAVTGSIKEWGWATDHVRVVTFAKRVECEAFDRKHNSTMEQVAPTKEIALLKRKAKGSNIGNDNKKKKM